MKKKDNYYCAENWKKKKQMWKIFFQPEEFKQ